MTPRIELVYDSDCPNVSRAREALASALSDLDLRPRWVEWDRASPAAPDYVAGHASPAILIDGRDVVEATAAAASSCRLYVDSAGRLVGVPPRDAIREALRRASGRELSRSSEATEPEGPGGEAR
jgi:hypothetical protein